MLDSDLHLRQTATFIAENPVDIVVRRTSKIPDGRGGNQKDTTRSLPPQTVRRVGSTRISGTKQVMTVDGRLVIPTYALIGLPDVDIQRGDKFDIEGLPYEVVSISLTPPWRVQADVVEQV
jgi:hypothetical protein